jgi:HEAT repeat protein
LAQTRSPSRAKRRVQADFSPDDFVRIEAACALFGVGKSDLMRRLVRASLDVGPALSADNTNALVTVAKELRAIGRNIAQIVKGINLGYAPQLADDEALFRAAHAWLDQIDTMIHDMTITYGSRLRREAGLMPLRKKEPA